MKIGLIFIIIAFSALMVCLSDYNDKAYAQNTPIQNVTVSNSTIYVMGSAQTMVKPDKVTLSLSIETTNTTANEALTANSRAMNNTLEALKAADVQENE